MQRNYIKSNIIMYLQGMQLDFDNAMGGSLLPSGSSPPELQGMMLQDMNDQYHHSSAPLQDESANLFDTSEYSTSLYGGGPNTSIIHDQSDFENEEEYSQYTKGRSEQDAEFSSRSQSPSLPPSELEPISTKKSRHLREDMSPSSAAASGGRFSRQKKKKPRALTAQATSSTPSSVSKDGALSKQKKRRSGMHDKNKRDAARVRQMENDDDYEEEEDEEEDEDEEEKDVSSPARRDPELKELEEKLLRMAKSSGLHADMQGMTDQGETWAKASTRVQAKKKKGNNKFNKGAGKGNRESFSPLSTVPVDYSGVQAAFNGGASSKGPGADTANNSNRYRPVINVIILSLMVVLALGLHAFVSRYLNTGVELLQGMASPEVWWKSALGTSWFEAVLRIIYPIIVFIIIWVVKTRN